jgi:hypothetical protein
LPGGTAATCSADRQAALVTYGTVSFARQGAARVRGVVADCAGRRGHHRLAQATRRWFDADPPVELRPLIGEALDQLALAFTDAARWIQPSGRRAQPG